MANIKEVKLDRFDGGIISSDRADNFNAGAAMVRHFDIYSDPKRLYPLPAFERWNTSAEEALAIRAIDIDANTSSSDVIYGLGKGIKNWVGKDTFPYRVKFTRGANITTQTEQIGVDLSRMPSEFWDNVDSDETGIGMTRLDASTGSNEFIPYQIVNWDYANQTGWIFFKADEDYDDYYIYYGSTTVSTNSQRQHSNSLWEGDAYQSTRTVHHLFENVNEYKYNDNYDTNKDFDLDETASHVDNIEYVDIGVTPGTIGPMAKALTGTTPSPISDNDNSDTFPGSPDNSLSISWTMYLTSAPLTNTDIIDLDNGTVTVTLNTNLTLDVNVNRDGAGIVTETSSALSLDTLYRIRAEYISDGADTDFTIYVNGVVDVSGAGYGEDIEFDNNLPAVGISLYDGMRMQNLITGSGDSTGAKALQDYKILFDNDDDTFVVGAEEAYSSITPEYSGISIYQKANDDSEWVDGLLINAYPVRLDGNTSAGGFSGLDYDDMAILPGFLRYAGTGQQGKKFFWLQPDSEDLENDLGSSYGIITASSDQSLQNQGIYIDFVGGALSDKGIRSTGWEGIDSKWYFSILGSSSLKYYSGGDLVSSFSAYPTVTSIDNYSGYLLIGGFRNNRSFAQLWDRSASNANQEIDFGLGNMKNIGVIKGDIVAVIDGFIDNADKSVGNPYMEIRRWTGGTTYDTPSRLILPTIADSFDELYLSQIYNKKVYAKNAMLFYAKLPANADATEWNEGFWGVGKNEQTGQLGLSLFYETDTSDGTVYDYISSANNLYMTSNEGVIHRISSSNYTHTSSFETLKFHGDLLDRKKKLHRLEVTTEALDDGQEITLYYKADSETAWTKVGVMNSGINQAFSKAVDDEFPNFHDIQFKVESVGGGAAITEIAFRYSELAD